MTNVIKLVNIIFQVFDHVVFFCNILIILQFNTMKKINYLKNILQSSCYTLQQTAWKIFMLINFEMSLQCSLIV